MLKRWTLRRRDFETSCAYRREFSRLLKPHDPAGERGNDGTQELVFGELVSNAVKYGSEPMGVCVEFDDASLTIVVENAGACADCAERTVGPDSEGGRGLAIVRALVTHLEIERTAAVPCRITATMPVSGPTIVR